MCHIPKAARVEWARTLPATLYDTCQDPDSSRPWLSVLILARCVLVARPGEQGKAERRSAAQRVKEVLLWQEALGELSRSRGGTGGVKQSLLSRRTTPAEPEPWSRRSSSPGLPELWSPWVWIWTRGRLSRRCRASTLGPPPLWCLRSLWRLHPSLSTLRRWGML